MMGYGVSGLGDLNRDGHADVLVGFLVGTIFNPPKVQTLTGEARVLSGKDGSVIHKILDPNGTRFGAAVGSAGDVDQDSYPDFYVGNEFTYVVVYSGKTGKPIISHLPPAGARIGSSVFANVGDVDRDGVPDLGWGGFSSVGGVINTGIFMVISNKTGKLLYKYSGNASDYMGGGVLGLGDLDGDGHADFCVAVGQAHSASVLPGYVQAWSGKTGKPLFRVVGTQPNEAFGKVTALLGDVTGDGMPEFVVSSQGTRHANGLYGRTTMFSTKTLGLTAAPYKLNPKNAGVQYLVLDMGLANARQNYWVVGSFTGTRPGTPLGGFTVPLNFDAYTAFTISSSSNIYLSGFRSKLDSMGRATAIFRIPTGLPAVPDFTLYHAALVYKNDGTILTVTNHVTLRLEN